MKTFVFDTETALIAPGRAAPPMACMTWATDTDQGIDNPDQALRRIRGMLKDPEVRIVGHNVAFDLGVIAQADPTTLPLIFQAYDQDRVACTMVNNKLAYIAGDVTIPNHSLAAAVKRELGVEMTGKAGADAWRMHYRKLIPIPLSCWPEEAVDYALLDAVYTRDLWNSMHPYQDLYRQSRSDWALHLMGAWGFRVDPSRVYALEQKLTVPVEEATERLKEMGVMRANGTTNQKYVRELMEQAFQGRITDDMRTPTGQIKTSKEWLSKSGHPALELLASVSDDRKEISSFLPMLLEAARTGLPVNPYWNVLVNTGRTSCRNPNAQQLPRRSGVRECVVPRDGNLFFGADYDVAELKSLAQVLYNMVGPNSMQRALNEGKKLHLVTAATILNIPYEEAVARYKRGDKEIKSARQKAKALNFGFPGGLGIQKFIEFAEASYGLKLTADEAQDLKEQWLDSYPEMRGYFNRMGRMCSGGRRPQITQHWSGRVRGNVTYTSGCNTYFQGLTADGMKLAHYEITRRQFLDTSSDLYGTRCNALIHDELLVEGPADQVPGAAEELAKVMVEGMSVVAPDVVHTADPYVSPRWYKDAEGVRDEQGRLMPWEPKVK